MDSLEQNAHAPDLPRSRPYSVVRDFCRSTQLYASAVLWVVILSVCLSVIVDSLLSSTCNRLFVARTSDSSRTTRRPNFFVHVGSSFWGLCPISTGALPLDRAGRSILPRLPFWPLVTEFLKTPLLVGGINGCVLDNNTLVNANVTVIFYCKYLILVDTFSYRFVLYFVLF